MYNIFYTKTKQIRYYPLIVNISGHVLEIGATNSDNSKNLRNCNTFYINKLSFIKTKFSKENQNKYIQGVCEDLPFKDNTFDAVIGSFFLCSVTMQHKSIDEIYRVLKPQGVLLIIEHTKAKEYINRLFQKLLYFPVLKLFNNCHLNSDPIKILNCSKFKNFETEYYKSFFEPNLIIKAVKS